MLLDLLLLLQQQAGSNYLTFQQMKDRLADWLGADNEIRFPDSVRGDLINMARRELSRRYDLIYNEVTDSMDTVAGQRDYDVPTGWSRPLSLWYLHSGKKIDLDYLRKTDFDTAWPDASDQDLPAQFTVWGGKIQLAPTPGEVLPVIRNYYVVLPMLSNAEDADLLMANGWECVLFLALAEASKYMLEDPRVPMWQARSQELLAGLVHESARARTMPIVPQGREPS